MSRRTAWLRTGLLAVVALAALALVACGGAEEPQATEELAPVQELKVNLPGEPDSIDPQRASLLHLSVVRQLFRPLLWFDGNLEVSPGVALEVPTVDNGGISEDGLIYTFRLRADAKWSDGQLLTAVDFEYALKRLFDPALASPYAPFYFDIEGSLELYTSAETDPAALSALRDAVGVEAVDDSTLVIRLRQPKPSFPELAALWPVSPVRQDLIERYGDRWTEAGNLVGNGPFVLSEWAHGDHMTLEANPNWYGEKPYLERIVVRMIEDNNAALAAYQNNELDIVNPPMSTYQAILSDSAYAEEVNLFPDLSTFALVLNVRGEPFDDPQVREAFSMAIDREAFVEKVRSGVGKPAYTWVPPGMPGYQSALGQEYAFDAEGARQALTEAGYDSGDGFPKVSFTFADTSNARLLGEFVQAQIKEHLGIDIDLEPLEPHAFQEQVMAGEFQMSLLGWRADYPDAENWLPDVFGTDGGANLSGYSDPEFDAALIKAVSEMNSQERLLTWQEAERIVVEDQPFIFLAFDERLRLVKPWVKDLIATGLDGDIEGDLFFVQTKILAH
jgi:oligopeptide transport system substrate-binding protein